MKPKIILTVGLMFMGTLIPAQNERLNLQKYWHYRYRLVNYYMVVGEGPGMSLPADIRHHYNGGTLRWGEAPVYLGYYIGVLATEYRLLKNAGQSTDQTLSELYYALKAVVRLDNVAENSWNLPASTNGFLIRDDVYNGFLWDHYAELNIDVDQTPDPWPPITVGSGRPGEATAMGSDFYSNYLAARPEDNAASQDNIYPLIMGFALVEKYLDYGLITFQDYVTNLQVQADFRSMAIDETDKIVSYIKENSMGLFNHHWIIKDPNGVIVDGGNPFFTAHALALAGEMITGESYVDAHTDPVWWQHCQNENFSLCDPIANKGSLHPMVMVLAALTNSWEASGPNPTNTTPTQILALGDYEAGGNHECAYFDNHFGWDVFYGMLYDVFHGSSSGYIGDLCYAQQIINSAPWDGPYYHDPIDKAYPGWCATRRFFDDPPRQNTGKQDFEGNYNGLDFMLLFNLYYLDAQTQAAPIYIPSVSNPFISDHYPYFNPSLDPPFGGYDANEYVLSPDYPVIVNQLSVTSGGPGGPGFVEVYGGAPGVLLTNTTVDQYATLNIFNSNTNTFCLPTEGYFFDALGYHLRVIGVNGDDQNNTFLPQYAPTTEFTSISERNRFCVFPSPASNEITLSGLEGTVALEISDINGKILLTIANYSDGATIDIGSLSAGCYLIKATEGTLVRRTRFIKQ